MALRNSGQYRGSSPLVEQFFHPRDTTLGGGRESCSSLTTPDMRDRGAIRPQAAGLAFERLYKIDQTGAFWTLQHASEMWGRQPLLLINEDGTVGIK